MKTTTDKLTTPDWMMIVGGLGVMVGSLLHWERLEGYGSGATAFDFMWTGVLPWGLLVNVAALVAFLPRELISERRGKWARFLLAACVVGSGLLLIRVVWNPGFTSYQRGVGMVVTFLASLVSLTGAVLKFARRPETRQSDSVLAPPSSDMTPAPLPSPLMPLPSSEPLPPPPPSSEPSPAPSRPLPPPPLP